VNKQQRENFVKKMGNSSSSSHHVHHVEYRPDPVVAQQVEAAEQKGNELSSELADQEAAAVAVKIEVESLQESLTLSGLEKSKQDQLKAVVTLAATVDALPPSENHPVAFVGKVSVGKSTAINSLSATPDLCEVGFGDTTLAPKEYVVDKVAYYDMQGLSEDVSYFNRTSIAILKSVKFLGVMIESTVGEMSTVMRFLVALKIPFYVIVNKVDAKVGKPDKYTSFKEQIRREADAVCSDKTICKGVLFVSGENLKLEDGPDMVNIIAPVRD
jgi:GTP-binding protein EngB required for normal cell division